MKNVSCKKGISLIEVVLGAALILGAVTVLVSVNTIYFKAASSNIKSVKAQLLLEEGVEAIRTIRDGGWTTHIANLTNGTTYYLSFNTSTNLWSITTTPQYVEGVLRSFVLSAVNRDSNDDIVTSGGSSDSGTRKVVVNVAWVGYSGTSTDSFSTYISNVFKN